MIPENDVSVSAVGKPRPKQFVEKLCCYVVTASMMRHLKSIDGRQYKANVRRIVDDLLKSGPPSVAGQQDLSVTERRKLDDTHFVFIACVTGRKILRRPKQPS